MQDDFLAIIESKIGKPREKWSKADLWLVVDFLAAALQRLQDDYIDLLVEKRIAKERGPVVKKRGRPRTRNILAELSRRYSAPRKPGRPKGSVKHTDEDCAQFIRFVEREKSALEAKTNGRVTYKDTLTDIITRFAQSEGKSVHAALRKDLAWYQKEFSRCRKRIPNNSK